MRTSIDSIINSPSVSTIGEQQKSIMDAALRNDSILKTRKGVGYRKRQCVDDKANIIQLNTSHRGILSAICRLPTEILLQIFVFCLPQDQHLSPKPGLAPVLLTTVCQRWREVAIGFKFPKLWCMLQLEVDRDDWQQKTLCHDTWLKRSRGCPLSLGILCYGDFSEIQKVLQPYAQQISSLTLYFFLCDKPFVMDDFYALKELTILQRGNDPARAIDKSLSKLPVNLHRLDLTCVLFNPKQLDPDSAWARLTHIKIKIHELDEFIHLLCLCPNLSSLSMFDIMNPIKIEIPGPVTHANLEYLHVHGSLFGDYDVGVGLFNAITLPNLCLLDFHFRHKGLWPHGEFKAFVKRSKCPLESLIFGMAMSLTDQQRGECTSLLPSLEQIVGKGYSKDLQAALVRTLTWVL